MQTARILRAVCFHIRRIDAQDSVYAARTSCKAGGRSYGLRRCGIESSCTPDRVYLARSSYKSAGHSYGLRRFTDCTLPLNPPPRRGGGLVVARRARSGWNMDAGSITRVRLCSVYMLTECLACPAGAATAYAVVGKNLPALRIVYTLLERRISPAVVVTASPLYKSDLTPTPPSGGAFVARQRAPGGASKRLRFWQSYILISRPSHAYTCFCAMAN